MFEFFWTIIAWIQNHPILSLIILVIFTILLKIYMSGGVCKLTVNLTSKIVVITGANAGIGQITAQELANAGATVIMACRDIPKAEKAKESIKQNSKSPDSLKIDIMHLDLSDLSSIRQFAQNFKNKYKRLDILINNAGIMALPNRKLTKDGLEVQIGTNHFGHFLLTNLLLDVIKESKPSRIINVASLAHTYGYLNLDDVNYEKFYNSHITYGGSKLANVIFTKELAARLEGTGVKTCCLHPGVVRTELMRYMKEKNLILRVALFLVHPFFWLFTKSPYQGAQTTLHCALLPHEKLENGAYYCDCKTAKSRSSANDLKTRTKLWEISEKLVKL